MLKNSIILIALSSYLINATDSVPRYLLADTRDHLECADAFFIAPQNPMYTASLYQSILDNHHFDYNTKAEVYMRLGKMILEGKVSHYTHDQAVVFLIECIKLKPFHPLAAYEAQYCLCSYRIKNGVRHSSLLADLPIEEILEEISTRSYRMVERAQKEWVNLYITSTQTLIEFYLDQVQTNPNQHRDTILTLFKKLLPILDETNNMEYRAQNAFLSLRFAFAHKKPIDENISSTINWLITASHTHETARAYAYHIACIQAIDCRDYSQAFTLFESALHHHGSHSSGLLCHALERYINALKGEKSPYALRIPFDSIDQFLRRVIASQKVSTGQRELATNMLSEWAMLGFVYLLNNGQKENSPLNANSPLRA